jgi:YD repeat-containing protein
VEVHTPTGQKKTSLLNHPVKALVRGTASTTDYTYGGVLADNQPNVYPTPLIPVEQEVQTYGITSSLLKQVLKSWANERLLTVQQTILPTATANQTLLSETDWNYCTSITNNVCTLSPLEQLQSKQDYDFGSSGVKGSLLRNTVFTYQTFTPHIIDKPLTIKVQNGGGAVVTGVTYGYDGVGNMLSRGDWLNTGGTSFLSTAHTYDGYGNMLSTTDPNSNTTNYTYGATPFIDTCKDVSSSGVTPASSLLTNIAYPSSNGIAHTESFDYNCSTGNLASSTDENGQTTSYSYADPLSRLTQTTYPTGWGMSTIAYDDTPGSLSMETKRIDQGGAVWADTVALFDGLFHTVSQSTANGETTPWDRKDTCYDGLARTLYSIYPYQATSATVAPTCTGTVGAGDTFTYDALNRLETVTHSDSTVVTTTYTGRATDVKDEGNGTHAVERISQSDALGRLNNICEVTASTQSGVSPSSCGLDYTGTGFLTTYGYDVQNNLLSVTQGAETRSFSYDPQSRLLASTNPESGTISYVYDSNSNCSAASTYLGELISKTDARGVRTCMQYDALHRLTGKTYSDGLTPAVTYGYDETSKYGHTLTYTNGRRSSESTAGTYPTGSVFSYDTLGHVIDNSQ